MQSFKTIGQSNLFEVMKRANSPGQIDPNYRIASR